MASNQFLHSALAAALGLAVAAFAAVGRSSNMIMPQPRC